MDDCRRFGVEIVFELNFKDGENVNILLRGSTLNKSKAMESRGFVQHIFLFKKI